MTVAYNILQETVVVLAGHASGSFVFVEQASRRKDGGKTPWSWTLRLADDASTTHPGERAAADALASLAAKFRRVRLFAMSQQATVRKQILVAAREKRKRDSWQNVVLSRLGSKMLDILRPYEEEIFAIDDELQQQSYRSNAATVTLIDIRARLEEWEAPLTALNDLVSVLLYGPLDSLPTGLDTCQFTGHDPPEIPICPKWSTGELLDLLSELHERSVGPIQQVSAHLLNETEDHWCKAVCNWMCFGIEADDANLSFGSLEEPLIMLDQSSRRVSNVSLSASIRKGTGLPDIAMASSNMDQPSGRESAWHFAKGALPLCIAADEETSDAILYVGRAVAKVNGKARHLTNSTIHIPEGLTSRHLTFLKSKDARPCSQNNHFRQAIKAISRDVSEWMWRNILTPNAVLQVYDILGKVFLHRDGLFSSSFLQRLYKIRKEKLLTARSASAALVHAADVELAMQRAAMDSEHGERRVNVDQCRVCMPKQANSAGTSTFDSITLGLPFTLKYQVDFPLDLIISPKELEAYSNLFSFLLALKGVRMRLDRTWHSVSQAQRSRRRFTGTGEGGDSKEEAQKRKMLLRNSLGVLRLALWFVDNLLGHFHTDVIDVHFSAFLSQLDSLRPAVREAYKLDLQPDHLSAPNVEDWREKVTEPIRRISSLSSLRGGSGESDRHARSSLAVESLARQLGRVSVARSAYGGVSQSSKIHQGALPKLLSAHSSSAQLIKSAVRPGQELDFITLRTCHQRFLAIILESLTLTNANASQTVWDLLQTMQRLASMIERWGGDALPDLLSEGSVMDAGFSHGQDDLAVRTTRMDEVKTSLHQHIHTFIVALSSISAPAPHSSPNEAQVAAMRHHEQLLLRLDFNHFISQTQGTAGAADATEIVA
jgi:hypothetical protein